MAKKKKEKELNPVIIKKDNELSKEELLEIGKGLENSDVSITSDTSSDNFYKHIIKNLYSTDNIGLKTEYLNVAENFAGAKMSFLSKYCDIPFLDKFITEFEMKRVSLERKGRKEILMALQERHREEEQDKIKRLQSFLTGGV